MQCSRCGRALDAQAVELGACRYCGQAIPTGSLKSGGNTAPTLPQFDQSFGNTLWNEPGDKQMPTEFGPPSIMAPEAEAPSDATAPFTASAPAPNAPLPSGGVPQQSAYPPFSALPAQRPPTAPAPKGGRKKLALAIVAAILLIAVIGGGLFFARSFNTPSATGPGVTVSSPNPTRPTTPAPTATPTPTPIPTSLYRDPGGLFSIQYPAAWTHQNFSPGGRGLPVPLNGVRFSGGSAEFVILTGQELPGVPTTGLADQADTMLLNSMNARNISSARPVTIGGQTWTEKSADTNGGKHTVIASISFHTHLYSLWYSAPASALATDETQFFNPMTASFKFGG